MTNEQLVKLRLSIQKSLAIKRKAMGITQEELAGLVNCTAKAISDIESGRRGLSVEMLLSICDVLKVDVLSLFEINKTNGGK